MRVREQRYVGTSDPGQTLASHKLRGRTGLSKTSDRNKGPYLYDGEGAERMEDRTNGANTRRTSERCALWISVSGHVISKAVIIRAVLGQILMGYAK